MQSLQYRKPTKGCLYVCQREIPAGRYSWLDSMDDGWRRLSEPRGIGVLLLECRRLPESYSEAKGSLNTVAWSMREETGAMWKRSRNSCCYFKFLHGKDYVEFYMRLDLFWNRFVPLNNPDELVSRFE